MAVFVAAFGVAILVAIVTTVWLRRKSLPTIMTPDGRRAWAFLAILGGCIVFTVFAAIGVYQVRDHQLYTLVLALAAHVQILLGLTAMGFVLGRRMQVSGGRDGVVISDAGGDTVLGAQIVAGAATGAADAIEKATKPPEGGMPPP